MRFTSLTRRTEIGANSYVLELEGRKLVVDAGLHPKEEGDAALPLYRLVPDGSLDAILISHAHQDHIGGLMAIFDNFKVKTLWVGREVAASQQEQLERVAASHGTQVSGPPRHDAAPRPVRGSGG